MEEVSLLTIGKIEENVLEFIKGSIKRAPYERLLAFLDKHDIKHSDIQHAWLDENEDLKQYRIAIKGYELDLYFNVKKEDFAVE